MNKSFFFLPVSFLTILVVSPVMAADYENNKKAVNSDIPNLKEIQFPATNAKLLTQQPAENEVKSEADVTPTNDADISVEAIGEKDIIPESTPIYVIEKEEIQKQGATSVADVLKKMPGFAINDVGHGADIHTGTYYRGASINQSVFLINGRQINTNISTYHGGTDLNSIPIEAIERVELYSGTASSLYGSSAFGGVVNIITKEGYGKPKFNANAEFGSLNLNNQQLSYSGSSNKVKYNFSFERFFVDNRYSVPVGAANRDIEGKLSN
ncbi:MAG: TonB-dependent receptor, partial [Cuspidothrix sp.]